MAKGLKDERGVSVIVGVVLVMTVFIAAFAVLYPIYGRMGTREAEAGHMESVRGSFIKIKSGTEGMSEGDTLSVEIQMSAEPPFFLPWPGRAGILSATEADNEYGASTFYAGRDARIVLQTPGTNYGGETFLALQAFYPTGCQRSILGFDISSIPAGSIINSATLGMYYYQYYPGTYDPGGRTIWAYRLTENWVESGVTWNSRSSGVSWTNGGGTYTTTSGASTIIPSAAGWMEWDVEDIVQAWVDGTANYGFIIRDASETSATNYIPLFRSREYDGLDPKLVVTWTTPPQYGALEFEGKSWFYPSRTFTFEGGAVIENQQGTVCMSLAPELITAWDLGDDKIRVNVNLVRVNSEFTTVSEGTMRVKITCVSSRYEVAPAEGPNRREVVVNLEKRVRPGHEQAWRKYLEEVARELNDKGYNASLTDLELTIRGKGTGNDIYYYERVKEIKIEAWVA